ncbi:MAG: hypothetical protein AMXMBFR4_22260 [Candidatus Hydrogenedentota bacterium]
MTCDAGIVEERAGPWRILRRENVAAGEVERALMEPGEIIKASRKSETRRVGPLVVKLTVPSLAETLKLTALRNRYRRAWDAALYLENHDIPTPPPVATAWQSTGWLVLGSAFVSGFLEDCVDVERYADSMIQQGAGAAEIQGYLSRIAQAVNALTACGAVHTDLAGKNILTRDGQVFYFIDLDGILLKTPYTDAHRFKNQVQLYDSFVDRWGDEHLRPFLDLMMPNPRPGWFDAVRAAQAKRRARTVRIWSMQGRI